jgi:hypothetical protein
MGFTQNLTKKHVKAFLLASMGRKVYKGMRDLNSFSAMDFVFSLIDLSCPHFLNLVFYILKRKAQKKKKLNY